MSGLKKKKKTEGAKKKLKGVPYWYSGQDSGLSLPQPRGTEILQAWQKENKDKS